MQGFLCAKPKLVDYFNFDHYNRACLKAQQNFTNKNIVNIKNKYITLLMKGKQNK